MKVPIQAPPVLRETYSWAARPPATDLRSITGVRLSGCNCPGCAQTYTSSNCVYGCTCLNSMCACKSGG